MSDSDDLPQLPPPERRPGFWSRLGRGLAQAGRAAGRGVAGAYNAVDPDARRQLAQMPLVGLTQVGPRRAPVRALPDDGWPPVVFVHGFGGHRGNFGPMRAWFAVHGRRRTYSADFPPGARLDTMARHLSAFLGRVVEVNDLPEDARIDLVAHSMGGLVCRLALLEYGTAVRVRTLVTMGTPHRGTEAARFADTEQARELRPGSPVLRTLDRQLPWRPPPRLVSL